MKDSSAATAEIAPTTARVAITAVSWASAAELDLRQWAEQGRRLGTVGRGAAWWLGDWLRYGNAKFGERYSRASRITGYDVQTLMNMAYVASRFDISRRRERLSWSHHAEIAALPPEQQERWLDDAEEKHLSVHCLREEMRRERRLRAGQTERAPELPAPAETPSEPLSWEAIMKRAEELTCPECGSRFRRAGKRKELVGV